MPVMDGKEAAKQIRDLEAANEQQASDLNKVYIVGLSGDEVENRSRNTVGLTGINEFLTKPVKPAVLERIVVKVFQAS